VIFCDAHGGFLNGDNLHHREFKRILKKAGLRQVRIHDLRHTFATIFIAKGQNPKYIQNQMGHGSIQIRMDLNGHLVKEVHKGAAKRSEDSIFDRIEEEKKKASTETG